MAGIAPSPLLAFPQPDWASAKWRRVTEDNAMGNDLTSIQQKNLPQMSQISQIRGYGVFSVSALSPCG
jgi:hypothetical protein